MTTMTPIYLRDHSMDQAILQEIGRDVYKTRQYLHDGDTVVDVGGYTGIFASHVHSHFPNARIISLEPVPENFECLERNAGGFATLDQSALTDRNGQITLYNFGLESSACHSVYNVNQKGQGITVQCKTLQQVMIDHGIEHLHFLKLDCQGCEFDVLRKTPSRVLRSIDYVAMEVHKGIANTKEMLGYLPHNFFKSTLMKWHLSRTHRLVSTDEGIQIWQNKRLLKAAA